MRRRTIVSILSATVSGSVSPRTVAAATTLAEPAIERGVLYASPGGQQLRLDMARPSGGEALPAIICLHGGGWSAGRREDYAGTIGQLARRGYVAMAVSYRLAPDHQFPAAVHDAKAAVRWARANAARWGIDPMRIGITGDSAGGHLALCVGATSGIAEFEGDAESPGVSSAVSAVVSLYGPSDLSRMWDNSTVAAAVLPPFLGGDRRTALRAHLRASPLNWVTPNAAAVLAIHGSADTVVAPDQSELIIDRLREVGVEADLLLLHGAGHGFEGADRDRADAARVAFFERHLRRA